MRDKLADLPVISPDQGLRIYAATILWGQRQQFPRLPQIPSHLLVGIARGGEKSQRLDVS